MKIAQGKFMTWALSAMLAVSLLSAAPASAADNSNRRDTPSAFAMAVDATMVRPLGFVSTVLGTALFVVTLPFSAIGGNVNEAGEALVAAPARMTFVRPLGHFDED